MVLLFSVSKIKKEGGLGMRSRGSSQDADLERDKISTLPTEPARERRWDGVAESGWKPTGTAVKGKE